MTQDRRLSDEDQARVNQYLNQPIYRVQRKAFRPWLLLGIILLVMTALSLLSYLLAYLHGVV
jgi:hypothetical protein